MGKSRFINGRLSMADVSFMNPILSKFEIIRPTYERNQTELLLWLAKAHSAAEARKLGRDFSDPEFEVKMTKLLSRYGCAPDRVAFRGAELSDVLSSDFKDGIYRFFGKTSLPRGAGIFERNLLYSKIAESIFDRLYPKESSPPPHVIHVTCTGYVSPSPAQKLIERRGWSGKADVTHAYHMGCYGSIPAIRIARGFVLVGQHPVDIVHTEICSLHLNALDHSPEQLVVQSLFADGYIKYSASQKNSQPGLELLATSEWLIRGTSDLMTWIPAEWGMQMTLDRKVPEKIADCVDDFVDRLLIAAGLPGKRIIPELCFAIHPGGPRIIDSIVKLFGLRDSQFHHSSDVLREYGNMSSATLPHIWKRILDDPNIPSGRCVLSLAFGPGLTIFGALLRKNEP